MKQKVKDLLHILVIYSIALFAAVIFLKYTPIANILLKTAPFLDISAALKQLVNSRELHIVAVNGEVKELLWVLQKKYTAPIQIKTVNMLKGQRQTFNFFVNEEKQTKSTLHLPKTSIQ